MTATVLKMPIAAKIECSSCGAKADASCNCGAPYIPAGERAAKAVAANPEKSNRALAAEIGVSEPTVRRAREGTASHDAVDTRLGLDGKVRKLPTRPLYDDDPGIEDEIDGEDPQNYVTAFWMRVDSALAFAVYDKGPVTKELAIAARKVARAWENLANQLEKKI